MSMIPWELWQTALYQWATQVSGRDVVWAKQETNLPQPKRPFIQLDIMGVLKVGEDGLTSVFNEDAPEGQQFQQDQYGTRRVRLEVQVFARATGKLGESAMAIAQDLNDSLGNPMYRQILVNAGLGVADVAEVQDLAQIEQSQFAGRASFDITLEGAATKQGANKGQFIERVIGEGDVEGNSAPEVIFDVTG